MNSYLVNGVEKEIPNQDSQSLRELIQQIRKEVQSAGTSDGGDGTLISTIVVNGVEIDANDEQLIGAVPVSQLRSLEIFTAHPKEIAEETLQSLIEFTTYLEALCRDASKDVTLLPKLADGITTFIDALSSVKQILHVNWHADAASGAREVQVIEADLASILKDMLEYRQKREMGFLASIINDALAANLALWRTEGLPALIRARDS